MLLYISVVPNVFLLSSFSSERGEGDDNCEREGEMLEGNFQNSPGVLTTLPSPLLSQAVLLG